MARSIDEILQEALALPEGARGALAAALIESLDPEVDPDAEAAWQEEIARRLEEVRSGAVEMVPWTEIRRRMLGR